MGLRDLYAGGEVVSYDPSPGADIMKHSQLTNGASSAAFVLSRVNGNTVIHRQPPESP